MKKEALLALIEKTMDQLKIDDYHCLIVLGDMKTSQAVKEAALEGKDPVPLVKNNSEDRVIIVGYMPYLFSATVAAFDQGGLSPQLMISLIKYMSEWDKAENITKDIKWN